MMKTIHIPLATLIRAKATTRVQHFPLIFLSTNLSHNGILYRPSSTVSFPATGISSGDYVIFEGSEIERKQNPRPLGYPRPFLMQGLSFVSVVLLPPFAIYSLARGPLASNWSIIIVCLLPLVSLAFALLTYREIWLFQDLARRLATRRRQAFTSDSEPRQQTAAAPTSASPVEPNIPPTPLPLAPLQKPIKGGSG